MKIIFRATLLAAFAALAFWLWTILFPSPEKIVAGKISSLAAAATFDANDGNVTRAAKASHLTDLFSTDVQISLDAPGQGARTISGRDELREIALAAFASLTALKVQFLDVNIRISIDKQSAEVNCTARVMANASKDYEVQELRFELKKIEQAWLISRVETVKTLS